MIWIAPPEKDADNAALEGHLWDAADQFRANFGLKSREYSALVLGLIFLRFTEVRFAAQRAKLERQAATARPSRRSLGLAQPSCADAPNLLNFPP
jgi:type I restriction enzyme M protein